MAVRNHRERGQPLHLAGIWCQEDGLDEVKFPCLQPGPAVFSRRGQATEDQVFYCSCPKLAGAKKCSALALPGPGCFFISCSSPSTKRAPSSTTWQRTHKKGPVRSPPSDAAIMAFFCFSSRVRPSLLHQLIKQPFHDLVGCTCADCAVKQGYNLRYRAAASSKCAGVSDA